MIALETLRDYESRGLIKSSERGDGFTVWCYTPDCVIGHCWDDVTKACRGLVFGPGHTLVSRPYPKFFNWNQPEAVMETGPFDAYEKMDGTLIVVGNYQGKAIVSTKGSFGTWHTPKAESMLMGYCPPEGVTALFELITPENRVVLDYKGFEGLVLLGGVWNDTGEDTEHPDEFAENTGWPGEVVVRRNFNLPSMIKTIQDPEAGEGHEGFVVVWTKPGQPANRVKLKFDMYLKLHAVYSDLNTKRVWNAVYDNQLDELLALAPDEFEDAIVACAGGIIQQAYETMATAMDYAGDLKEYPTRGDAARALQSWPSPIPRHLTSLIWMAYDGKEEALRQAAVKLARPETKPLVVQGTTGE
jgi:RNA ligase